MTWKEEIRKIEDPSLTPENIFIAEMPLSARTVKEIKAGEYDKFDLSELYYGTEAHARGYIIDGVKVIVYLNEEDPSGFDGFSTFTIPDERDRIVEVAKEIHAKNPNDFDRTKNPNKKGE